MKQELRTEQAQNRVAFSGDSFGNELSHSFEWHIAYWGQDQLFLTIAVYHKVPPSTTWNLVDVNWVTKVWLVQTESNWATGRQGIGKAATPRDLRTLVGRTSGSQLYFRHWTRDLKLNGYLKRYLLNLPFVQKRRGSLAHLTSHNPDQVAGEQRQACYQHFHFQFSPDIALPYFPLISTWLEAV